MAVSDWFNRDTQLSQGVLQFGGTQSSKKQYSEVDVDASRRSYSTQATDSRVFAPSYSLILNSAGATLSKKDAITSSPSSETTPDISGNSSPRVSPAQSATSSGSEGASLLGGSAGTLVVLGGIGIAGYILIKRFGGGK